MTIKKVAPDDPINNFFHKEKDLYEDYQYPESLEFFSNLFSNYCNPSYNKFYNWKSITNIPDCKLFKITNKNINFTKPPIAVAANFDVIELPLYAVLKTLGDDYCVLSPQRWHRVREQLSNSNIEYPEITLDLNSNTPVLMDGRHRIIAMIKFLKMETAPFVCNPYYTEIVKNFYGINQTK